MHTNEEARAFVEFFRRDLGAMSRNILVPAGILVFFGAPAVCYGAAGKVSANRLEIGLVGLIILLSGLLLGFLGMARLVSHDVYVAVARDGLMVHLDADTFYPWSDLRAVVAESEGLGLEFEDDRAPVHVVGTFGDLSPKVLAERLEDWRRKAGWSLTPSNLPPR